MDFIFDTVYKNIEKVIKGPILDLKEMAFCDPWSIGMICLSAIEYKNNLNRSIILPKSEDIKKYLKRMHFDDFMKEISYG